MPIQLTLPDQLGELRFSFSFWIPPTSGEIVDKDKGGRRVRTTDIFAYERERSRAVKKKYPIGKANFTSMVYTPEKNLVERANILQCFIQKATELELWPHLPWGRGHVGYILVGQTPDCKSGWPGRPHMKKPDSTNMAKQFEDALNPDAETGFVGLWLDDTWAVPLGGPYRQYGDYPGVLATLFLFENPLVQKPVKEKTNARTKS